MRRLAVIASTAIIAGLVVGGAQGGTSSGKGDFLIALIERPGFAIPEIATHTTVLARSGPNGENAVGFFASEAFVGLVGNPFSGKVTCLRVEGNRAVVAGIVTKSQAPNAPVGSGALLEFTDNGFPGAGRDTNLNFIGYGPSDPELTTCPFVDDFPEITITKGDVAVHDG